MSSIMEDDYAPPTRHPWISILMPLVLVALVALGIWWWRNGD